MDYLDVGPKSSPDKQGQALLGQVPLKPAAPSTAYGLGKWFFGDPNHDLDAVTVSRSALIDYPQYFDDVYQDKRGQWPYPLRILPARHSGLPALLNGFLEGEILEHADNAEKVAGQWLAQPLIAEALFGASWDIAQNRFIYHGASQMPGAQAEPTLEPTKTLVHARFIQMHGEWPVYGGDLVVHLAVGEPRAAATNSYFPLKEEITLKPPEDEARARAAARQAALTVMAQSVTGPAAIGLWWEVLHPWVEAQDTGSTLEAAWSEWHDAVLQDLTTALSALEEEQFTGADQLLAEGGREFVLRYLKKIEQYFNRFKWQIEVAPYAESPLFIFPFVGDFQGEYFGNYYLAYRFELVYPAGGQAWRVFVDALTATVLGEPESLLWGADVYHTSGELFNNHFTSLTPLQLSSITDEDTVPGAVTLQPIDQLVQWRFHSRVDPGQGAVDFSPGVVGVLGGSLRDKATLEAVNIAFHAKKIYRHFVNVCGADATALSGFRKNNGVEPLRVFVGMGGTDLGINFQATEDSPKQIIFQTDPGNGLTATTNKTVHDPSRDPEVIFHEFAHALMRMINPLPFDQQSVIVPFGRAILEGYANYFARSLGERTDAAGADDLWARGAYCPEDWGDEWALGQDSPLSVANQLAPPSIYPVPVDSNNTLPVYDVGMIWARALWEIRTLFGNSDLADRLALASYEFMHGWVTNYEIAAEGLIDAARKESRSDAEIQGVKAIFTARGIPADLGVRALAALPAAGAVNPDVLVGSGRGVVRFTGNAAAPWAKLGKDIGVMGIAANGAGIFMAAEGGVFQYDQPSDTWVPKGLWNPSDTPLSILTDSNNLFVGTANGVMQLGMGAGPATGWLPWRTGGISWKMTAADLNNTNGNGTTRLCLISNLTSSAGLSVLAVPPPVSRNLSLPETDVRVVDLAVLGNDVYAATAHDGVFVLKDARFNGVVISGPPVGQTDWVPGSGSTFDRKNGLLCLGVDARSGNPSQLLAGAVNGLYRQVADGIWSKVVEVTTATPVTCILSAGTQLFVGTADQHVWVNDFNTPLVWRSFQLPA